MRHTHAPTLRAVALPALRRLHHTIPDPLEALAARKGRMLRVGILSDFTRAAYANGAVFQTRFLARELRRRGHHVTIVGPHDPSVPEPADATVSLPSRPLVAYPGLHVPLPLARWIFDPDRWDFDVCLAQTTSFLLELGTWLRRVKRTPLLCVNTTHLAAAYECLLPAPMAELGIVHQAVRVLLERPVQRMYAAMYNGSDGLIVLSEGLAGYWRRQGVEVPIHVIPRAVEPEIFDSGPGPDPLPEIRGPRLLCAGRMTREKAQDRAIRIFAENILPARPDAHLVLVGDGPDLAAYRRLARRLGVAAKISFTGEVPFTQMPAMYAHSDVFVHTSLSETFGNVLSEALWSGRPAVAFDDGMGASAQIHDGANGRLLDPGGPGRVMDRNAADRAFAGAVLGLLDRPEERARLGRAAAQLQRERSGPPSVMEKLGRAFLDADARAARDSRPEPPGWAALEHAARWALAHGVLLAAGRLRRVRRPEHVSAHPAING